MKLNVVSFAFVAGVALLAFPDGTSARISETAAKICHCDQDSGLCGEVDKPVSSVANFLETSEHDFEMKDGVEAGCCLGGCEANCGEERKLDEVENHDSTKRVVDGRDLSSHIFQHTQVTCEDANTCTVNLTAANAIEDFDCATTDYETLKAEKDSTNDARDDAEKELYDTNKEILEYYKKWREYKEKFAGHKEDREECEAKAQDDGKDPWEECQGKREYEEKDCAYIKMYEKLLHNAITHFQNTTMEADVTELDARYYEEEVAKGVYYKCKDFEATDSPTIKPSPSPSASPSTSMTSMPSLSPSASPSTSMPSPLPSASPSTSMPSPSPSASPSTSMPSPSPSASPSTVPTCQYGYCPTPPTPDEYGRNLAEGKRRNRNLCIEMECCLDLRGGPPQCVPAGTCKLIHSNFLGEL